MRIVVKFKKLSELATIPKRATEGSSGFDLFACLTSTVVIDPGERVMIPTDIAMELPPNYEAQIRSRSGMTWKHGVIVANGIGTIDADFRGHCSVILLNTSDTPYVVDHGDRVAQMVIMELPRIVIEETKELSETDRSSGGIGSTGK